MATGPLTPVDIFNQLLLLRGIRAIDGTSGQLYDVNSHICVPQGGVYATAMPTEGIDFSKYKGGLSGLKGTWKTWLYEDGGAGAFKATVHPDVEETVVEAFTIVDRCNSTKDDQLSKTEFDTCARGRSAEDQQFDLEYVLALEAASDKLVILADDKMLSETDPNTYPELITAKGEIAGLNQKNSALTTSLKNETSRADEAEHSRKIYQWITAGEAALIVGLIGLAVYLKRRRPSAPENGAPGARASDPSVINVTVVLDGKTHNVNVETVKDALNDMFTDFFQNPAYGGQEAAASWAIHLLDETKRFGKDQKIKFGEALLRYEIPLKDLKEMTEKDFATVIADDDFESMVGKLDGTLKMTHVLKQIPEDATPSAVARQPRRTRS